LAAEIPRKASTVPVLLLQKYQDIYYERLEGYHKGKVFEWLDFFLDGVIEIAGEAIRIAERITSLREEDMLKIQGLGKRSSESGVKVLSRLFAQPIVNVNTIKNWTGFTRDGAYKTINRFIDLGILEPKELDKKYGQSYAYKRYLEIFDYQ